MNLRMFSVVVLASALPLTASAGKTEIKFTEGDFLSARPSEKNGKSVLSVKLSKSGKAKLRKLAGRDVPKKVNLEIDGATSQLIFREAAEEGTDTKSEPL